MLRAIREADWTEAERIRGIFRPLEDLRNAIHPIRVLHEAVRLAGIAQTGPLLPLLSNLGDGDHGVVRQAAGGLLRAEREWVRSAV
jgi:dihydrodipicolinate synthase/N-acetylneuraminate lyase